MSVTVEADDILNGTLTATSNVRPNKLFTADESIVLYKIGTLKTEKLKEVVAKVIEIFSM